MPFVEAFRQFQFRASHDNFCNIHVSLVPQVRWAVACGEGGGGGGGGGRCQVRMGARWGG